MTLLFLISVIAACETDEDTICNKQLVTTYKVAVILEQDQLQNWDRTSDWLLDNLKKAQARLEHKVELSLSFKCQEDGDINEYMQQIADDSETVAVIGPSTSEMAEKMAAILHGTGKPMLSPCATDVEYQRKYSSVNNVWNMAESDIAQLEIMLSNVRSAKETKVMLLAYDDYDRMDSQTTYIEWFAFIAEEFGMKEAEILLYRNEEDIRKYARQFCGSDYRCGMSSLIFYPKNESVAVALDDEIGRIRKEIEREKHSYAYVPRIICTDAFVSKGIAGKVKNTVYEGLDLCASPESGFATSYNVRYGEDLMNGEAQFYDALLLLAYALTRQECTLTDNLCDAICEVVDGRDDKGGGWLPADIESNFIKLRNGILPDLEGVSGEWTFDEKTHVCQLCSTFRYWRLHDGEYKTMGYYSTEGSKRSSSSKEMWNWTATHYEMFDNPLSPIVYPELHDRWAVIVAASDGWSNYRFQADAFAMYQLLKKHGYDDEHIILVVEDDIAYNSKNVKQGELRTSVNGENLYDFKAIDYKLSRLSINDLGKIIRGEKTERLTKVINPTENDNVFIFWSGHGGRDGSLDFGIDVASTWQMRDLLQRTPHRKMLVAVEACYSGMVGKYCEGLDGILIMTAANQNESSMAAEWDESLGVYLSNGFTRGFQEAITANPFVSLRDLYYTLSRNTDGSHVKVYNESKYGNVYSDTMNEYLK